ncbi:acyl-coenzyme A thioesterase THEM4-like [Hyperolius riggenbachi]|uniref:acyl-coenzyme A thioesterase THEM4-like n=1 Tax=Hyperolius riggenbachi TaxID=752182 RepID=UPI0035A2FAFB
MLYSLSKLLPAASTANYRHVVRAPFTRATLRCLSVGHAGLSHRQRDYALPNASWSHNMLGLYNKFMELGKTGNWQRIPSYKSTVHPVEDIPLEAERGVTRIFTRNLDKDGIGFEYCMFVNKNEKRTVCILQPGPYLEGNAGYIHGGGIATMIDATAGTGIIQSCGRLMTVSLTINYRTPLPVGAAVTIDSQVEKVEGRKIYSRCQVRSYDDTVLYAEATGLFVTLNPGEEEANTG